MANLLKGDIRNFPCYARGKDASALLFEYTYPLWTTTVTGVGIISQADRMRTKFHYYHHRRLRYFPFIILALTVEKCLLVLILCAFVSCGYSTHLLLYWWTFVKQHCCCYSC